MAVAIACRGFGVRSVVVAVRRLFQVVVVVGKERSGQLLARVFTALVMPLAVRLP